MNTKQRILDALIEAENEGRIATIRELQQRCGLSSTSVAFYNLQRLAEDGDVTLGTGFKSVRVTSKGRGVPSDQELLRECRTALTKGTATPSLLDALNRRLG